MHGSHTCPPALTAISSRSFQLTDRTAVEALAAALAAAGAEPLNPAPAELHRFSYAGGLALMYRSGAIVVAGQHPGALLQLLDSWAENEAAAADAPAAEQAQLALFGEGR